MYLRLDYVLFAGISLGALALLHAWVRRSSSGEGVAGNIWLIVVIGLISGNFLVNRAEVNEKNRLTKTVEGFAPTYAQELTRMGHAQITLETPPDDQRYMAMIKAQIRWQRVNPTVTDIYTFRRRPDGATVLLVDSETDYDNNGRYEGDRESRTKIGEVFEEVSKPLERAFGGEATFDDEPYTDRWGTWVSAFVPMRDETGQVEAVLGVDYPARNWAKSIAWTRITTIGFIGIIEFITIVSTTMISLMKSEIKARKRAQDMIVTHNERLEHTITERSKDLLEAQRQIMQNEKLASVGQLAAGIAHEINTPIQYIGDNLRALSDFVDDLTSLVNQYRNLVQVVKSGTVQPEAVAFIEKSEKEQDLEFILEDAPNAIGQALEGVDRVANIVRAMKTFSHFREEATAIDLIRSLESTITVARNEYKYVADVKTEFEEIPAVECCGSELNQVFLNLIVNAAHAIADTGERGVINIAVRPFGADTVEVAIGDTGTGIPEKLRHKIFDPFFTTKGVGKGTGQGLSIAHQIIVQKHNGTITYESELGKGTTFFLRIPIKHSQLDLEDVETDEQAAHSLC